MLINYTYSEKMNFIIFAVEILLKKWLTKFWRFVCGFLLLLLLFFNKCKEP